MSEKVKYNFDPSTADAVEQDFSSLTASEARMPGTNPPAVEKGCVTDMIIARASDSGSETEY